MKNAVLILIASISARLVYSQHTFLDIYGHVQGKPVGANLDGPLILTPLIEQNKIEEAQAASKVNFDEFGNVTIYSEYLTVGKVYDSNLFFWFFPAYETTKMLQFFFGCKVDQAHLLYISSLH